MNKVDWAICWTVHDSGDDESYAAVEFDPKDMVKLMECALKHLDPMDINIPEVRRLNDLAEEILDGLK